MRVAAALALLALAALAAAGCGGGDEAEGRADVPEQWRTVEQPRFSFATPPEWTTTTRDSTASPGEKVTEATVDGTPAGVQLIVGATPRFGKDFSQLVAVNDADTRLRLPKRKLVAQETVQVEGAKTARLTILDLPAGAPGGNPTVPIRAFDLIALSEAGTSVNLFARVPVANVESTEVRRVVDSLRLRDPK